MLTAAADGRVFVFGARRFWERNAGPSPRLARRDQRTPLRFLIAVIAPGGHLRVSGLSLPEALTPLQYPSIALSPDGRRLAVAFGGSGQTATLQVITLASGRVRQWTLPHSSWTPSLGGEDAWTANGQTLAFEQQVITRRPMLTGPRYLPVGTQVRFLATAAPGSSLASASLLVLRPPAGESAPFQPVLIPDGTRLIAPVQLPGPRRMEAYRANGQLAGELAVYSARTGALLHTQARWAWQEPGPPGRGGVPIQAVAWSNRSGSRLIVLQPRDDLNVLGLQAGNTFTLAGSKLLPRSAAGYQELQYALRETQGSPGRMAW